MVVNLLFFTVTLTMNKMTAEEALQQERFEKIREENIVKCIRYGFFL